VNLAPTSPSSNSASRIGSGAQFQEAGGCEILIEGKSFTKATIPHHLEARRIDE
jgi:hypothetical protein